MEQPRKRVEMRDFPGLATSSDDMDGGTGTSIKQENLQSRREGFLQSRPGYQKLTFEEE